MDENTNTAADLLELFKSLIVTEIMRAERNSPSTDKLEVIRDSVDYILRMSGKMGGKGNENLCEV